MPFIPHTQSDIDSMLQAIGADSIEQLFDEIPQSLRAGELSNVPEAASEMQITRIMHGLAAKDTTRLNFAGAGAYEHHIPAAVWQITTRGEFYSAYTPYQAEASQGTLQVIYEYQTMLCGLTGMDVSNASLYDGATALAEALLMAVRANRKSKSRTVLIPATVHPEYLETVRAICTTQDLDIQVLPFDPETGITARASLNDWSGKDVCAVVIPQPNFFGKWEAVDALTDWAHANASLAIAVVNPTALAITREPGAWGAEGVDIVCGEGQPLGSPLSSGGPYFGFMACRQKFVRQLPGRIVGRTVDIDGTPGFALTLQAREQHIRRGKATSNICTNQGLLMTAATIYMSIVGSEGLAQVARASMANTAKLAATLTAIDGVEEVMSAPGFHERVIRVPGNAQAVIDALATHGIVGGVSLGRWMDDYADCLLVCATETKTDEDIASFASALATVLQEGAA